MSTKLTIKNHTITKSKKDNIYQLHISFSEKCWGIGLDYIDNGNLELLIEDCEENPLFDVTIPLPDELVKSFEYINYDISKNKDELYVYFYEFPYEDEDIEEIQASPLEVKLREKDEDTREEKTFQLLLKTGFFSNLSQEENILKLWKEQFPDSLSTFDFLTGENSPESGIHYLGHTKGNMMFIISVKSKEDLTKKYDADKFFIPDYNKNDFFNDSEYCILEGDDSLTERTLEYINTIGKSKMMALTNIYKDSSKLKGLAKHKPSFLVIDTTMFNSEKIKDLLILFKTIDYIPKKVIYLNEVITTEFPYEKWEG